MARTTQKHQRGKKSPPSKVTRKPNLQRLLNSMAERAAKLEISEGSIPLHLHITGSSPTSWQFRGMKDGIALEPLVGSEPLEARFTITASEEKIRQVLEGKLDAARAFVSGGIQVRGDLAKLEDLLTKLELLKCF